MCLTEESGIACFINFCGTLVEDRWYRCLLSGKAQFSTTDKAD